METGTAVSIGTVITAYLAKDGIAKLLGPTADYLGEGLRHLAERRIQSIGRIFSNASEKLGNKLEEPGQVPPRVLKTVMNEGSYFEDPVALEYFGGVLASSRTEDGRDDRGARLVKIVDNLSTYQIRTHYLLYSTIASLFSKSGKTLGLSQNRAKLETFLPLQAYGASMNFSQAEWTNPQLLGHIWNGLSSEGLIETRWQFGSRESLKEIFAEAPGNGIVCQPSSLGAELFLWAFGHGNVPIDHMLSGGLEAEIDGLPKCVPGAVATKS